MKQIVFDDNYSGAEFSECRKFRYSLWRIWDERKKGIAFVGLNPSTADEVKNDPTVSRCINFAKRWGYGRMWMLNIFAYRSTDPKNLYGDLCPIGQYNNLKIVEVCKEVEKVVLCCGVHGKYTNRFKEVCDLMFDYKIHNKLYCFGLTKKGYPRHPLYLPNNIELEKYSFSAVDRFGD